MARLCSIFRSHHCVLLRWRILRICDRILPRIKQDDHSEQLRGCFRHFDFDLTVLQLHNLLFTIEKVNAASLKRLQRQHTALLLECVFVYRNTSNCTSLVILEQSAHENGPYCSKRISKDCAKNHLCIFTPKV